MNNDTAEKEWAWRIENAASKYYETVLHTAWPHTTTDFIAGAQSARKILAPEWSELLQLAIDEVDHEYNGVMMIGGHKWGFPAHDKSNCRKCITIAKFEELKK
jgi:hypothetical protein